MDEMRIDGQKLDLHIDRVFEWKFRGDTTPVYVEISPTAKCNHNCNFCALDYANHTTTTIPDEKLIQIGTQLARLGVRGVMFGGEGEPTLHQSLARAISHYSRLGVDCALTTNGSGLDELFAGEGGQLLKWVKVSINAGCADDYALIHRVAPTEFLKVFERIGQFRSFCSGGSPTVGVQAVALPQNSLHLPDLCSRAADAGLDYVTFKPFSPNMYSPNSSRIDAQVDWEWLRERCLKACAGRIKLVMRDNAQAAVQHNPNIQYTKCLSVPYFWFYIRSNMDVVACSNHMLDNKFVLGNLATQSLQDIWYSHSYNKREQLKSHMRCMDVSVCRKACRMDQINQWLWHITQSNKHSSFI